MYLSFRFVMYQQFSACIAGVVTLCSQHGHTPKFYLWYATQSVFSLDSGKISFA